MTSTATGVRVPPSAPSSSLPLPADRRWSRWELLPVAVLLVLGTVLLLPGHGLWFDELFTAEVGRLPLGDLVPAIVAGEGTTSYLAGVPPSYNAPYYLVLSLWTSIPGTDGDTALRLFSLLATAGGLALVTRAVTRLAGRATGIAAGTLLAVSPLLLEQAVEARSYGLAVLATGAALLGLVRWLARPPDGLLLFGLAGAGMGLAHWYAVTTLAGFVVAALVLRRWRALPVAVIGALAALPAAGFVALALANGTGDRNAEHLSGTGGRLSWLAVEAWAGGLGWLALLTVGLAVVGAVRARGVRTVAAAWVLVPLVLLTAVELFRPVYHPRYLLTGLLGLAVLAAAGAMALPRRLHAPAIAVLLAGTLIASLPVLDRGPRERSDELVTLLAGLHADGEPIVAADQRSAMGLDHYVRTREPQLRPDVVLPPADAPPDADRVWLVRRLIHGVPEPTDDDAILRAAGLAPAEQWDLPATKTDLILQLWTR